MTGTYLDASGLVKLAVREPETDALRDFLAGRLPVVSSVLTRTEALRAVRAEGPGALERVREVLRTIDLVAIDDEILETACMLDPVVLRTLDAIHVATALAVSNELDVVITYDDRMARAAEIVGLRTATPR